MKSINPTELDYPVLLMSFPFGLDTTIANNIWMQEIENEARKIDYPIAYTQFLELYKFITQKALVYLLPTTPSLQDQVYTANLGCYLPHIKLPTALLANFKGEGRKWEEYPGRVFLKSMGYKIFQPPYHWEGEADLKWLRDNIYCAGYGIRTDISSLHWMEYTFDMQIIASKMTDPRLYHFDTTFFPLTQHKVLLANSAITQGDVHNIEKVAEVIEVPKPYIYGGLTNLIKLGDYLLVESPLPNLKRVDSDYTLFKRYVVFLEGVCAKSNLNLVLFDMGEFLKSGAALSCFVMHLNLAGYHA